ncbi:Regulator of nonsense transcripts UPF3 [Linum perenne]
MAKGNPKKEVYERTKVVVRHLPPSLSRSELFTDFDHLFSDRYNWVSFRPGKSRNSLNQRHSRAYIDFKSPGDVMEFAQFFNGHRFVNEKGAQFCAVVEYAPSQRVPKPCAKDSREGSFLRDSLVVTPLMDFVRKKRAAETGSSKVRRKKPSRKDKALVNGALGFEAKPSISSQKEGSQTKSAPRVRGSAKRLNKTADSGKKNTLQDQERKPKTSNQGREASERMIKHILLTRESRLKKPLTNVYLQERDHLGNLVDEKNHKTPSLVVNGSDETRNASENQFTKKGKAEKSSRQRRKMDKPSLGIQNSSLRSGAAKNTKSDASSRKAKGKSSKKGAAAGNPDPEVRKIFI